MFAGQNGGICYLPYVFNREWKDNEDRLRLTLKEARLCSRSKFSTLNAPSERGKNVKHLPYAFTEQGIYMLMTVLRGELAVRQSIALIKLFKSMKDYIGKESLPMTGAEVARRFESAESRIGVVESRLDLMMKQFGDQPPTREILIMENQRIEAGIAYRNIYGMAKESIIVIDDYVGAKTLHLLKACPKQIKRILLLSDNIARIPLSQSDLGDFRRDTGIEIGLCPTKGMFHDRYIILDYGLSSQIVYHCGPSSKDAGNSISTIMKMEYPQGLSEAVGRLIEP